MNDLRQAAQQALEALEQYTAKELTVGQRATTALRAALAEPVQEPYAWMAVGGSIWRHKTSEDDVPLYTAPPQRKPLTEEEIVRIYETAEIAGSYFETGTEMAIAITRAVEKAHGIGVKE